MNWLVDETENEFIIKIKQLNLKKENFKLVRFGDYFEKIVIPSKLTYDKNKVVCSKECKEYFHVPFYLATGNKHPDYYIHEQPSYVNTFNYRLIMLLFTGFCYEINEHEFAINGHNSNTVLRCLNQDVNLMVTCLLLSRKFKAVFSWSKQAIFSRIKDENVFVYLNDTSVLSSEFKTVGVIPKLKIDRTKIRKIKFSDYFEKIKPERTFTIRETNQNNGSIPLLSSTCRNNGIVKYITCYSIDLKEESLVINKNGSVGYCFVHSGKIAITTDACVFKCLNKSINLRVSSMFLTNQLRKQFNWSKKINDIRLKQLECYVYFN